jgi:hypothetical protein
MFALCARAQWAAVVVVSFLLAGSSAAQEAPAHTPPPVDLHGFVQVHYRTGDPLTTDGYKLRKADVKLSGVVTPRLQWRVAVDVAKALSLNTTSGRINDSLTLVGASVDEKSRILQEAALTYSVGKRLALDIGQQLLPLSQEGNLSLAGLETIERANFISEHSRGIGLGYVYDLGVSANGELPAGLEYHAGVFNEMGQAQGTTDANDQKAVIARLVYHVPVIPGLQFGGSGGWEPGPTAQRLQRLGPEAQYRAGRITLRAEAMDGRDGTLHRFGWYGLGAYRPVPKLQLAVRYDSWDRDESAESSIKNALERQVVLGANYLVEGTSGKIALNIIRQTFPNISSVPAATFALFAVQASW